MADRYFLEILNRSGEVERREELTSFPCRFGRDYSADIIVDDPYIDPIHLEATLSPEGLLYIADAGSRNGTGRIVGKQSSPLLEPVPLGQEDRLRLGHTMLRIRPESFQVPEALFLPPLKTISWAAVIMAMVLATLSSEYGEFYRPMEEWLDRIPSAMIVLFFGLAIWSGLFALAGRAFSRRLDFVQQFYIASLGFASIQLFSLATDLVRFGFGMDRNVPLQMGGMALLIAIVLKRQLQLFVRLSPPRLFAVTLSIAASVVLSPKFIDNLSDPSSRNLDERETQVMLPPEFLFTQGATIDDFLVTVDDAKSRAIQLAAKQTKP